VKKDRHYGAKQRKKIMAGQKASGLSVAAYCQQQGVPATTFYTWQRKRQQAERISKKGFIKIADSGIRKTEPVRIQTPGGYRIDIPQGSDGAWVEKILAAVQAQ